MFSLLLLFMAIVLPLYKCFSFCLHSHSSFDVDADLVGWSSFSYEERRPASAFVVVVVVPVSICSKLLLLLLLLPFEDAVETSCSRFHYIEL